MISNPLPVVETLVEHWTLTDWKIFFTKQNLKIIRNGQIFYQGNSRKSFSCLSQIKFCWEKNKIYIIAFRSFNQWASSRICPWPTERESFSSPPDLQLNLVTLKIWPLCIPHNSKNMRRLNICYSIWNIDFLNFINTSKNWFFFTKSFYIFHIYFGNTI